MKKLIDIRLLALLIISTFSTNALISDIQRDDEEVIKRIEEDEKQRDIFGVYDIQYNTVSNIEFPTTNYGIFGYDVANRIGGGVWPRGTPNQYIFGGGCWLGARKFPTERRSYELDDATTIDPDTGLEVVDTVFAVPNRDSMGRYCAVTYNPLNARSFMVPGNVIDGLGVDPNQALKYRTYFSTDYNQQGIPFPNTPGPNWPIWDTSSDPEDTLKYSRYFGFYVDDVTQRTEEVFPRGPAYISGEDIFATFKDTDLTAHDLGVAAAGLGYPLYLQTEITIYSWGFGSYQDFIFVKYNFVNVSEFRRDGLPADTLYDCYMAPIMDVDVARKPFSAAGAANDRVRYYGGAPGEDSTYNLAFQWSDGDRGEQGFGFGYLGFDFLESPATITRTKLEITPIVDGNNTIIGYDTNRIVLKRPENNMVRKDRPFYPNNEQLGLVTFQNWNIDEDRRTDEARYNFLSEGVRETDNGPGDKRFMMVTGPFNMRPGDSVRVVVGICLANTCDGGEATGETEDICELVALDEFMQSVYDNNFRAPLPPEQSRMYDGTVTGIDTIYDQDGNVQSVVETSRGLNNAAKIAWDETAEMSEDEEEMGLDFLGYRIYRARRTDLDTFSLSQVEPGDQGYTSGAALQGWKQIAQYELPQPFVKSQVHTVAGGPSTEFSFQDSLRIVGPYYDPITKERDENKVTVMRFPRQSYQVPRTQQLAAGAPYTPAIYAMDSLNNPWFELFNALEGPWIYGNSTNDSDVISSIDENDVELPIMKDALLGYVDLKPSVVRFNPMYYNLVTKKILPEDYAEYPEDGFVYNVETIDTIVYNRDEEGNVDTVKVYVDTVSNCSECTSGEACEFFAVDINGDSTYRCYYYERDYYESPTSDLRFIVDMNSYEPEVEVVVETRTDSVFDPATQEYVYFEVVVSERAIPTGFYTVQIRFPKTEAEIDRIMDFANFERIQETLDTIYSALEKGTSAAELNFPDFEGSELAKELVIKPYMEDITNGRTFYDVGDDNNNNEIDISDDVRRTEKLINQVPYYYRVLAYDEGHVNTGSQRKLNAGKQTGSPNVVEIIPKPATIGNPISFDLIAADSSLLGSLNSFDLFAVDPDRAQQLFVGDTIEVKFNSNQSLTTVEYTSGRQRTEERSYGLYGTTIEINNITDNELLYNTNFFYEGRLGEYNNFNLPTENTFSLVLADTVIIETDVTTGDTTNRDDIGTPRSNAEIIRGGQFSTGNFRDKKSVYTNGWSQKAEGSLSFEFNYYLKQLGGLFRPDSIINIVSEDPVDTKIEPWDIPFDATAADPRITNTTQVVGFEEFGGFPGLNRRFDDDDNIIEEARVEGVQEIEATFNNGPGNYRMILGPEQTMQRELSFGFPNPVTKTFNIPYHDVTVINETAYQRPLNERGDSVTVDLSREINHVELPVNVVNPLSDPVQRPDLGTRYPSPMNLYDAGRDPAEFLGQYNITTYGFVGLRTRQDVSSFQPLSNWVFPGDAELAQSIDSTYTGLQGSYVKTAISTDGQDTVDFVNMINIAGAIFYSDYANAGRFQPVNQPQFRRAIGQVRDTLGPDEFDPNAPNQYYTRFVNDSVGNFIVTGLKRFGNDLGEGDEVEFNIKGGVLGIPEDGATLTYVVSGGDPAGDDSQGGYTDDMLGGINVVPNPYYITHQAQRSPYDAKIYFNKLPKVCTIEIYTVTGELVRTINHDETSPETEREAVEVWDLLTDSGLRVASQSLVARIYTPDGAETLKTFSLVVGSFRIVQD